MLVHTPFAYALTRYVNPAGDNSDGTTPEKGWNTFADIVWTVLDDEESTLYITTGTYVESLNVTHNTAASRLYIKPYGGVVTIDGNDAGNCITVYHGYVTIDGEYAGGRGIILKDARAGIGHYSGGLVGIVHRYMEIYNMTGGTNSHGIGLGSYPGPGAATIVEYCYIHDNYADGINAGGGAFSYGNTTIRYNTIEDNRVDGIKISAGVDVYNNVIDLTNSTPETHADCIQGAGGYWRIYNNKFIFGTQQVFIETDDIDLDNVLIYNNIFEDGQGPAIALRSKNADIPTDKNLTNLLIANNTFVDATTYGIRIVQDNSLWIITNSEISNNIFYSSGSTDLLLEASASYAKADLLVYSNIFYPTNAIAYNATDDTGGPYDTATDLNTGTGFTGNTNSQPTFTNYAGGDYTLSASDTVAKDAGKDLSAYTYLLTDYAGNTRTVPFDIGAYEYQSGAGNTTLGSGPSFTFTGPAFTLN